MPRLDLREIPPPERHPLIREAFDEMAAGETLTIVNDHEPKPLFYEFQADVDEFDADGYEVERAAPGEYHAELPKR
jgi:uncharacterized protein (DUF2249 family)